MEFRFSCYNVLAQSHFLIQYLLELDKGGGAILVPSIRHALLNTQYSPVLIVALVTLFTVNLLYTMKMFLEFNLVVNKWTLVGHSVNITASWIYIGFSLAAVVMTNSSLSF